MKVRIFAFLVMVLPLWAQGSLVPNIVQKVVSEEPLKTAKDFSSLTVELANPLPASNSPGGILSYNENGKEVQFAIVRYVDPKAVTEKSNRINVVCATKDVDAFKKSLPLGVTLDVRVSTHFPVLARQVVSEEPYKIDPTGTILTIKLDNNIPRAEGLGSVSFDIEKQTVSYTTFATDQRVRPVTDKLVVYFAPGQAGLKTVADFKALLPLQLEVTQSW